MKLNYRGDLKKLVVNKNIAADLDPQDLRTIGLACKEELEQDLAARADWDEWYADAMKLALQVMEEKSFPWKNCSNVKFPLLTIAALNFHARAYPTLIGPEVVEYRSTGEDKDGAKAAKAARVSAHQNYQLLTASDWEEHADKALLVSPIMGCCFKKSLYDHDKKTTASVLVLPQNLVVPYYTASLEATPRVSELFSLTKNAFTTRLRRGQYLDWDYTPNYSAVTTQMDAARNEAQRITPTSSVKDAPADFVEQHRYLDLDDDGYAEPYIVTFVRETGQICRIVPRFTMPDVEYVDGNPNNKVAYIQPTHFYTKKPFIPSPDGGFYDLGLGMLLGPLNYAANSLINQLIDAGTMHNLGGGFLGRGVKIRRGENTFEPFEWKQVDSTGASLKDNIVPLPVRNPSDVLLQLLTFLVGYGEKISGSNDIAMGEIPGQNVKAETMAIANANGQRIFAAIYKRWWRSDKEEYCKLFKLTKTYIKAAEAVVLHQGGASAADYEDMADGNLYPIADPNVCSPETEQKIAMMCLQMARSIPGQDVYEAQMRVYKAFRVQNPDLLFPNPKGPNAIPAGPDVKMLEVQIKSKLADLKGMEVQNAAALAVQRLQIDASKVSAQIQELQAKSILELKQADGIDRGHAIALIDAQVAAYKTHQDGILQAIKIIQDSITHDTTIGTTQGGSNSGSVSLPTVAAGPTNTGVLPLSGGLAGGGAGPMAQAQV